MDDLVAHGDDSMIAAAPGAPSEDVRRQRLRLANVGEGFLERGIAKRKVPQHDAVIDAQPIVERVDGLTWQGLVRRHMGEEIRNVQPVFTAE